MNKSQLTLQTLLLSFILTLISCSSSSEQVASSVAPLEPASDTYEVKPSYYPDGTLMKSLELLNEQNHGVMRIYDTHGLITRSSQWENGQQVGDSRQFELSKVVYPHQKDFMNKLSDQTTNLVSQSAEYLTTSNEFKALEFQQPDQTKYFIQGAKLDGSKVIDEYKNYFKVGYVSSQWLTHQVIGAAFITTFTKVLSDDVD